MSLEDCGEEGGFSPGQQGVLAGTASNEVSHHYYGPVVTADRIDSANFGAIYGNLSQCNSTEVGGCREGLKVLVKNMAEGAAHDSAEQSDAPKCMPGTRVAVQDEILSWILHGERDAKPGKIMWVSGPAGSGKTAILRSIADTCQEKHVLAASFFFSSHGGSVGRRTGKRLIPTLAYQLLQHKGLMGLRESILASIERNPAIFTTNLKAQFKAALMEPLQEVQERLGSITSREWPRVIVLDGLDECEGDRYEADDGAPPMSRPPDERAQREILQVLLDAVDDPTFPFRILVASRPEPAIHEFITGAASHTTRHLFLGERYTPGEDILLFCRSKLSIIRRRWRYGPSWPGHEREQRLVENASGQFQYASAAMLFVEGSGLKHSQGIGTNEDLRTPDQRLNRILAPHCNVGGLNPLEPLDRLYKSIMETCPDPLFSMKWLRATQLLKGGRARSEERYAIYTLDYRVPLSIGLIRLILEVSQGEENHALGSLSSLLPFPQSEDLKSPGYRVYHKSFLDFINDRHRCGNLYVEEAEVRDFITHRYFQTLALGNHFESAPRLWGYFHTYSTGAPEPEGGHPYLIMCCDTPSTPLDPGPENLDDTQLRFCTPFSFSSLGAFLSAEKAMLSCDVRKWVELLSELEEASGRDGTTFLFMFHSVHRWCPWFACLPACEYWRNGMIDAASILQSRGRTVKLNGMELPQNRRDFTFRVLRNGGSRIFHGWKLVTKAHCASFPQCWPILQAQVYDFFFSSVMLLCSVIWYWYIFALI